MKKTLLIIGIIIASFMVLIGILYFFNGSLEMYPTEEQIEKSKITAVVITVIGILIDTVLIKAGINNSKN